MEPNARPYGIGCGGKPSSNFGPESIKCKQMHFERVDIIQLVQNVNSIKTQHQMLYEFPFVLYFNTK